MAGYLQSTPSSWNSRRRNAIILPSSSVGTSSAYGSCTEPFPVLNSERSSANASRVLGVKTKFACCVYPPKMNRMVSRE